MDNPISTQVQEVTLRFAKEEDTELILRFIQELAEYEKLSHEVVTDVNTLRQSIFSDRPIVEVVIADYDSTPAGFALFFHNFSTFLGKPGIYLEDLYVKPEFRRKGIGQVLLSFLAQLARKRGCTRLEWSVLDWNEKAIHLYKKLGAKPMDEWTTFRITDAALNDLANQFER